MEAAKLVPEHFTCHLGFIADYIAEIFHNQLHPLNYTDATRFGPLMTPA